MSASSWRWRCPNGHTAYRPRSVGETCHHDGDPATKYVCTTCGVEFAALLAAKTPRWRGGATAGD